MNIINYEQLENLSTKMRILNQILIDIQDNGILAPALERELADNDLIDIIESINSTPKQETIKIIQTKIDLIKKQIQEILK
jgi:hypothetical protein